MPKKFAIEFIESKAPIREPVTKFGGQPVWIEDPQWPLSKATGNPMRFICQIAIDPQLFGQIQPRMAYLFMTDEEEYVDGTWEPDSGENAVILQPGSASMAIEPLKEGPTLYRIAKGMFKKRTRGPCEFAVKLVEANDPVMMEEVGAPDGNKIGGAPAFLQGEEFPGAGRWRLLLQLDSAQVPFPINFGDAGVGYAFLSEDGSTAKFLWQCC
jgi:uncharacterized protein YwqG